MLVGPSDLYAVYLSAQLTAFKNTESIRRRGTIGPKARSMSIFLSPELAHHMEMGSG